MSNETVFNYVLANQQERPQECFFCEELNIAVRLTYFGYYELRGIERSLIVEGEQPPINDAPTPIILCDECYAKLTRKEMIKNIRSKKGVKLD